MTGMSETDSVFDDVESRTGDVTRRSRATSFTSDQGFSNPMRLKITARVKKDTSGNDTRGSSSSRPSTSRSIPTSRLDSVQGFKSESYVTGRVSRMPRQSFSSDSQREEEKPNPPKQWVSPALLGLNSSFHKKVLERKKDLNKERAADVNDRLQSFMGSIPGKAY